MLARCVAKAYNPNRPARGAAEYSPRKTSEEKERNPAGNNRARVRALTQGDESGGQKACQPEMVDAHPPSNQQARRGAALMPLGMLVWGARQSYKESCGPKWKKKKEGATGQSRSKRNRQSARRSKEGHDGDSSSSSSNDSSGDVQSD